MSERFRKIDAAIKHCSGVVTRGGECAADHEELLAWLIELRGRWEIENRGTERANSSAAEVGRLRAVFPRILKALGNGAGCTPTVSTEFLESIPGEVAAEVEHLRARIKTLEALAEEQRACLSTYAEPGDPDYVPPKLPPARCMVCQFYSAESGEDWCTHDDGERTMRVSDIAVTEGPPPDDCPLRGGVS